MPDRAAQAVVKRFWGDYQPVDTTATSMMPIERFMQYKRLNDRGWQRIIERHGPDGAQQYREAMRELGRGLGLED